MADPGLDWAPPPDRTARRLPMAGWPGRVGLGHSEAMADLEYAAELLGMLAFEDAPREGVLAGQRKRLADFGDPVITERLSSVVSAF